jgi:hypothetical protein
MTERIDDLLLQVHGYIDDLKTVTLIAPMTREQATDRCAKNVKFS